MIRARVPQERQAGRPIVMIMLIARLQPANIELPGALVYHLTHCLIIGKVTCYLERYRRTWLRLCSAVLTSKNNHEVCRYGDERQIVQFLILSNVRWYLTKMLLPTRKLRHTCRMEGETH
jgi:hypothetical protein